MTHGGAGEHPGGCLCGGVRYRVTGALRDVLLCHCEQCRRTSGHYVAATRARRDDLVLERADALRWYASSPGIHRGFCGDCGSSLFWCRDDTDAVSIMAGTLDVPTGLRIAGQIHTASAPDYYAIDPAVPVHEPGRPPATATGQSEADPEEQR